MYTLLVLHTEQEVDGETLLMMINCATVEQLQACGLKTVKSQMLFRKLVGVLTAKACGSSMCMSSPGMPTTYSNSSDCATPSRRQKLKMKEIKLLFPEEKRLYLMK